MSGDVNARRGPGFGVRDPIAEERVLAEVDRELKAALSIAPSADLEARVLRRVTEDGVSGRAWYAFLAAAAVLVVATGLFLSLNRTGAPVDDAPRVTVERQPDVLLPKRGFRLQPEVADAVREEAIARGFRLEPEATYARTTDARTEPEVIVPLNQMEAIRRLVRAVNDGRVEAPPEPATGPIAAPAELGVAPIAIEPIPVPAIEPEQAGPSPEIRRSR